MTILSLNKLGEKWDSIPTICQNTILSRLDKVLQCMLDMTDDYADDTGRLISESVTSSNINNTHTFRDNICQSQVIANIMYGLAGMGLHWEQLEDKIQYKIKILLNNLILPMVAVKELPNLLNAICELTEGSVSKGLLSVQSRKLVLEKVSDALSGESYYRKEKYVQHHRQNNDWEKATQVKRVYYYFLNTQ